MSPTFDFTVDARDGPDRDSTAAFDELAEAIWPGNRVQSHQRARRSNNATVPVRIRNDAA
jgi:hypothetical protein